LVQHLQPFQLPRPPPRMMSATKSHQFTLTTVPLEQYFGNIRLGQGSGFMWKIGEQYYLVTRTAGGNGFASMRLRGPIVVLFFTLLARPLFRGL
jgi:hypothetical protein